MPGLVLDGWLVPRLVLDGLVPGLVPGGWLVPGLELELEVWLAPAFGEGRRGGTVNGTEVGDCP